MQTKQYEKLKDILREMFQMDQADLDFGIYRIMNAKRDEIEKFLDKELLPQVKEEFAKYRGTEIEDKKKELSRLEATLRDRWMNPDEATKVMVLREEVVKYGDDEALANEVFSHLSAFFRRYYDGGDFMSLRRYKKDTRSFKCGIQQQIKRFSDLFSDFEKNCITIVHNPTGQQGDRHTNGQDRRQGDCGKEAHTDGS